MKLFLNKKAHSLKNAGFTLVELVVSMTLTAIFATAVVAVMPSATRVYMRIEDVGRAQMVADMVVDALREECSDTYIEDYASVRIITDMDDTGNGATIINHTNAGSFSLAPNIPTDTGSILLLRKSSGFCEAIYSNMPITLENKTRVWDNDETHVYNLPYSSRAVYRLFNGNDGTKETKQGYVHFAFYESAFKDSASMPTDPTDDTSTTTTVQCFLPYSQYDYAAPFPADAYNGYTVKLTFTDISYTYIQPEAGTIDITKNYNYFKRPASVDVIVSVYKSDYAGQNDNSLLYTRRARLVFAEDTTDK